MNNNEDTGCQNFTEKKNKIKNNLNLILTNYRLFFIIRHKHKQKISAAFELSFNNLTF